MSAIEISRFVIGFASLIFVLEDWSLRSRLAELRPWRVQRADFRRSWPLDLLYTERAVVVILALRAAAAIGLLISPHVGDAIVLLFGTWWWAVRWRGNFNGACDSMTMIVLTGVLAFLWRPSAESGATAFIAANLVLSFVVAGLSKVRSAEWRSGTAPRAFATEVGVSLPYPRAFAWTVIVFELSFPLALLDRRLAVAYTCIGLAFHMANAWVFGLNRFLLAWAAAYPALVAVASR